MTPVSCCGRCRSKSGAPPEEPEEVMRYSAASMTPRSMSCRAPAGKPPLVDHMRDRKGCRGDRSTPSTGIENTACMQNTHCSHMSWCHAFHHLNTLFRIFNMLVDPMQDRESCKWTGPRPPLALKTQPARKTHCSMSCCSTHMAGAIGLTAG